MKAVRSRSDRERWWTVGIITTALILGAGWFLLAEHRIAGLAGYPLDDSWIYATFARNLATGHGYSFNPDQPISGATGPLYVFVLSALYRAFGEVIWPAKILGVLCLLASALIVSACVRRAAPSHRGLPLLAGLVTALSPPLLWGCLSGLEIPLYLLLVCAGMSYSMQERSELAAFCWSMGVWLRPDGLLLAGMALFAPVERRRRAVLVTALILVGYFSLNLALGGTLVPTSVNAKATIGGDVRSREWATLAQWLWLWGLSVHVGRIGPHGAAWLSLMVVGAILVRRRHTALAVYPLAFPIVFGLFGPNGGQHGRYLISVLPLGIVLGCVGLSLALSRVPSAPVRRRVALVLATTLVAWQAVTAYLMGTAYGWNVQNINQMHRFIAEEIVRRLPPGPVAVNDVGAVGYFGEHEVVDLAGLMSKRRSLPENLAIYRPSYMIIFPNWFQQYVRIDSTSGQPTFRDADSTAMYSAVLGVKLQHNTIASRKMMVVYKRFPVDSPAVANPRLIVH